MTRVVFWNIENFNTRTINDPTAPAHSADRLAVILDTLFGPLPGPAGAPPPPVVPHPDIIVIVECAARTAEIIMRGTPIRNTGAETLLALIRARTAVPLWSLVPPLGVGMLGHTEGVAVFYNGNNVQFTGPYVWGQDFRTVNLTRVVRTPATWRACPAASSIRPAAYPLLPVISGPQPYAAPWNACLPARPLPAGLAAANENMCAGQWEFYPAVPVGAQTLHFPAATNRSPWLTTFIDLADPAQRAINLYSVHTSPTSAVMGTRKVALIPDIAAPQAANSVTLIVGDFNVDTYSTRATAYDPLLAANYTVLFDPRTGGAGDPARRPYLTTHLLPATVATPFSGPALDVTHNPYPRFGYMGSMGGAGFATPVYAGAIDNAFVRYPAGGGPGPGGHQATVLNPIVGSPYAGPAAMPLGTVPCATALTNAIPAAGIADPDPLEPARFRQWNNFGKIRSTSDHLALSMVI